VSLGCVWLLGAAVQKALDQQRGRARGAEGPPPDVDADEGPGKAQARRQGAQAVPEAGARRGGDV
jgi:hypothetical protein